MHQPVITRTTPAKWARPSMLLAALLMIATTIGLVVVSSGPVAANNRPCTIERFGHNNWWNVNMVLNCNGDRRFLEHGRYFIDERGRPGTIDGFPDQIDNFLYQNYYSIKRCTIKGGSGTEVWRKGEVTLPFACRIHGWWTFGTVRVSWDWHADSVRFHWVSGETVFRRD